MFLIFDIWK